MRNIKEPIVSVKINDGLVIVTLDEYILIPRSRISFSETNSIFSLNYCLFIYSCKCYLNTLIVLNMNN